MNNYYYDVTDENKPYTITLPANINSLPPTNATRVSPVFTVGYHPCMQEDGTWVNIEDHRGVTIYNVETGVPSTMEKLGTIPTGYTTEVPVIVEVVNESEA